jgi:(1->4)-alpha-D-glucan 1-alpha-D-glucosylmutase
MASPGVPDIYQGNDLWDFSLVDPDNRRPVDYERRRRLLKELMAGDAPPQVLPDRVNGLASTDYSPAKLWLLWKALRARKAEAPLFERGHYIPLRVSGQRCEQVVAFAREFEGRTAIVVVPRLCATLLGDHFHSVCDEEVWGDTQLEISVSGVSCYHNALTGERMPVEDAESRHFLPVGKLLRSFPVALLLNEVLAG